MDSWTLDSTSVATRFWADVGYVDENYPRNLETIIPIVYPIGIVEIQQLSLASLDEWLAIHGSAVNLSSVRNRSLVACLLVRAGHGMIFVDGSASTNERRFAVAHELAHFLFHYVLPRERALRLLGEEVRDVLDGRRPATMAERLSGAISGAPIGDFTDYLSREHVTVSLDQLELLEREADQIALELLAPVKAARSALLASDATSYLVSKFGLPKWAADSWAAFLRKSIPRSDSLIDNIENSIRNRSR